MLRGRPLVGLGLAAVVLAGAYYGTLVSEEWRQDRTATEAGRSAREAALRAREIISVQSEAIELMGHNAVINSRLVVALRGRVDAETLADVFAGEAWWEPYRGLLTAISYEGTNIAYSNGTVQSLPIAEVIASARAAKSQVSRFVAASGRAYVIAATPMLFGPGLEPAIVVLGRALDRTNLDSISRRANAPLLLTDGKRELGAGGPEGDVKLLASGIGREAEGRITLQDTAWGAAAVEIATGLWLWAGSRVNVIAQTEVLKARARDRNLWFMGGGIALVIFLLSLRRPPVPDIDVDDPAERTHDDAIPKASLPNRPSPFPAVAMRRPASGVGTPLGRYMMLDRIGEGGMAEIFTAVSFGSSGFRRSFVIKRLRPEMAASETAVAHFIDEANLASTLVHPNIVPVFDFGEVNGAYFLAQEYIVGRDLGRLTRRMQDKNLPPLSAPAILYIAHEVLRGLHYAHERRADDGTPMELVHRDVTPENIMISERGEVKMLDFGIVKAAQRVAQTDIGIVKGNVDFMAPEQARGRNVDRRADVFSVGLVIYFAAARKPLYEGETLFDRLTRSAMGPGEEELARVAALPAPLPELLNIALAVEPDQRFQTAAAFAQAIADIGFGGTAELTAAISTLYGEELALEQDRLAAAFPRTRRDTDLREGDGNT
ncbi:MAG TPA: serine/threonine-protein kinase [Polyangia bacterium]